MSPRRIAAGAKFDHKGLRVVEAALRDAQNLMLDSGITCMFLHRDLVSVRRRVRKIRRAWAKR